MQLPCCLVISDISLSNGYKESRPYGVPLSLDRENTILQLSDSQLYLLYFDLDHDKSESGLFGSAMAQSRDQW